jgi:hypothetical protein
MERLAGKTEKTRAVTELHEGEPQDQAIQDQAIQDPAFEEALKNFRTSVHAWSDAAYSRPRTTARIVRHRSWRLAVGWALAGVLMVGGVSGGMFERHRKIEQARIAAAARLAERQKALREEQAKEEEDLLAKVDSDVSRQVPSAMEPLARLMDDEAK